VTVNDGAAVTLDENKIQDAAQWDGLHGIITNIKQDASQSLILRYARLWIISFLQHIMIPKLRHSESL
jgi:hypothetical protein